MGVCGTSPICSEEKIKTGGSSIASLKKRADGKLFFSPKIERAWFAPLIRGLSTQGVKGQQVKQSADCGGGLVEALHI